MKLEDIGPALKEIYDSETNFELSCFWDAGWYWKLGDELNGFRAEGVADTLEDAVVELLAALSSITPDQLREEGGGS